MDKCTSYLILAELEAAKYDYVGSEEIIGMVQPLTLVKKPHSRLEGNT